MLGLRPMACVLVLALSFAAPAAAGPPEWAQNNKKDKKDKGTGASPCIDGVDTALDLTLEVDGQPATGRYALPEKEPQDLVVFAHGYGHTSASWAHHMRTAALKHEALAVGMDYRGIQISEDSNGDGLPESRGWNAMKGAEDLVAAALHFDDLCPTIETVTIMGVSMGGNMSGLAIALAEDVRRSDGRPVFDHWIDVEGAVNVIETYLSARALAPANGTAANARTDIEEEAGGPIETHRDAYTERAVVMRVGDLEAAGLRTATVIHGLDDGLVPYNQAREIVALLRDAGIATDMYTIGRRSSTSERETTATGHIGSQLSPDYTSPLAGHASEKSETHIVMVTAFERLRALLAGDVPDGSREFLVDGQEGTFPLP